MKPINCGAALRLLLPLLFSLNLISVANAAIFSKQSGSWTAASTWEGGVVPTNFQDVVIKAGHTVTRSNAFTAQAHLYVFGTLIYQGNVSRSFNPGYDIEIQGILQMDAGILNADGIVYGNGTFRQLTGSTTFGRAFVLETTDIQGGTVVFQNTNNGNLYLDHLLLKNATITVNGTEELIVQNSMNWQHNGAFKGKLSIAESALLTFAPGNNTFFFQGQMNNYGSVRMAAGTFKKISLFSPVHNYGIWEFDVPANSASYVSELLFYNHGKVLKKGLGSAAFNASGSIACMPGSTIHVQQASLTVHANSAISHYGVWRVDSGASMLLFAENNANYVPFGGEKFINHSNVYGRVKFVDSNPTTLEGNGKFEHVALAKYNGVLSLAGSPEIAQSLLLVDGLIQLNQFDLRLGTASFTHSGNLDCYVETNGSGSCVRQCQALSSFAFYVGNGHFAPIVIQMNAGSETDLVKVRVTNTFFGEYTGNGTPLCSEEIPEGVVGHNWFVSEANPGGSNALLFVYWQPEAEHTPFDRSQCTLGNYAGGDWQPEFFRVAQTTSSLYWLGRLDVTAFGQFGVFDSTHEPEVNFQSPTVTANAPICEWDDLYLQANTSPNASIQWSGPNGFQSNQNDPVLPGIQLSQSGIYTVLAEQYGCPKKQSSLTVQVNAEPTPLIIGPTQAQAGESVTLSAFGGTSYVWNTGDFTQTIVVSPTQTTDFQVTVTNPAGCTAAALHTVQVTGTTAAGEVYQILKAMSAVPNPASDRSVLVFEAEDAGDALLRVTDARGALVMSRSIAVAKGENRQSIALTGLSGGVYHAILTWKNEVKTVSLSVSN